MRNASERRFKRQSSVIGNDRHTQSIHHSWPFPFFSPLPLLLLSSPLPLASPAIQDKDGRRSEGKKKIRECTSFTRWYLIGLWKPHCAEVNLEISLKLTLNKGVAARVCVIRTQALRHQLGTNSLGQFHLQNNKKKGERMQMQWRRPITKMNKKKIENNPCALNGNWWRRTESFCTAGCVTIQWIRFTHLQ